jgi:uncharacterized protein YjiK
MRIRLAFIWALLFGYVCLFPACKGGGKHPASDFRLIKKSHLQILEPSGITDDPRHSCFWIVDGGRSLICKTSRDGKVIETLSYKGQDIEGVCFDKRDSTLWITEERLRDVVHLKLNGDEIGRIHVNSQGVKNKGLEGVVIDGKGEPWVVNEKYPVSLEKIDGNGAIVESHDIGFAKDLSDVTINESTGDFYLLSDKSSAIYVWNVSEGLKETYALPRTKYEGISVNPKDRTIAVVNDDDQTMLVFEY